MNQALFFIGQVFLNLLQNMIDVFELANQCLSESEPDRKVDLSLAAAEKINSNQLLISKSVKRELIVGWPNKPILVSPQKLPKRKLSTTEGRAAMIHSFAHIEFNAINLAWDIVCRFRDMPEEFYKDWARVAGEEAKHFSLLNNRLKDMGSYYGEFDAHDGLWRIANDTANDVLTRLAVIPRIFEARGLDVTPDIINRFREIKDKETASILEVIYKDEIGHVNIGSNWFRFVCEQRGLNADETFMSLFMQFAPSGKNKINREARLKAGFTSRELESIS